MRDLIENTARKAAPLRQRGTIASFISNEGNYKFRYCREKRGRQYKTEHFVPLFEQNRLQTAVFLSIKELILPLHRFNRLSKGMAELFVPLAWLDRRHAAPPQRTALNGPP
jgi:hypothetical protein